MLRSWGIDTAADIDEARIADIPGFGKNLTDTLVIWRDMKARPSSALPPPSSTRSRCSASTANSPRAAPG